MMLNDYINKSKSLTDKNAKARVKIAFLSDFNIQGLAEVMKVLCFENSIWAETYDAPYTQYAQEILNKESGLYSFNPDIIFVILDAERFFGEFYNFPYRMSAEQRKEFIVNKFMELKELLLFLEKNSSAKIVFNNFLLPHYSSRGVIEDKQEWGLSHSINAFNEMVRVLAINDSRLFIFNTNLFCSNIGYEAYLDRKMQYLGDMRMSPLGLVNLGQEYMAYIFPLLSMTKKCIVLDLDNTLWGGIIGEDGIGSIKLGPEKEGKPFFDFQKRLLELSERGVILAINSSNNCDDAIEVMRKHKYMLLKEDNFACMKINWLDKTANMEEIAKELNIGLDSLVFFDDSKANCELIRKTLPDVMVIHLPEDTSLYPKILEDLKVFNSFALTDEDLKRGKSYISQKKIVSLRSAAINFESFLKQLEIRTTVMPADDFNMPRIAQLTQRTNQFNLTTKRYMEDDIKRFSMSQDYIVRCLDVRDKFEEYGITGVFILKRFDTNRIWEIDSFLLSCRVLGRKVEFSFMRYIVDEAKKAGVKELHGKFIPTQKNKPAERFLEDCGFALHNNNDKELNYILKIEE